MHALIVCLKMNAKHHYPFLYVWRNVVANIKKQNFMEEIRITIDFYLLLKSIILSGFVIFCFLLGVFVGFKLANGK